MDVEFASNMPTIKDVAQLAGVTVTTVSRVLNNKGYISDLTRKKVADAVKELDYVPNEMARSFLKQRSSIIGLIVPTVSDPLLGITRVRAICGGMMFSGKMGEKEISILSGGERSRVMLGKIIATPANLLFLDEPTNHLDMYSIDSLCDAIKSFEGSTILVTHSEMMLRELADALIIFHHDKAEFFDGNYDEFLEKIGWEEENDTAPKKVVNSDYNESKKLRTKLIQERSTKISPLKKQIEQCEAKIMKLEEGIKAKNEALIACSSGNDIGELQRLSKELKSDEEVLEKLYEQFETLHVNHDELFESYEIQLKNIQN